MNLKVTKIEFTLELTPCRAARVRDDAVMVSHRAGFRWSHRLFSVHEAARAAAWLLTEVNGWATSSEEFDLAQLIGKVTE